MTADTEHPLHNDIPKQPKLQPFTKSINVTTPFILLIETEKGDSLVQKHD